MGLFSSSKAAAKTSDKVWMTSEACLKGITTEALLCIKNSELPVIITFFEEAHNNLVAFFDSKAVPYQAINSFTGKDWTQQKNSVAVIEAGSVGSLKSSISKDARVSLLFFGHYPVIETENKIVDGLASDFPQAKISFCMSLDDALFEAFGSQSLKPLMEKLGMKDDEAIEHAMVSKSIKRALEKINERLTVEIKAHSEREWFTKNVQK